MKAKAKSLFALTAALAIVFAVAFSMPLALADETVTVNIASSVTFQNTGYNLKSWTVDVSKLKNAKQIVIHVSGQASGDGYVRYLIIKIDGQVVNPRGSLKHWGSYTALVRSAFDLRYDVTNLVKGKSKVTVEIGITTFVGSWTVSAEFTGALDEVVIIPVDSGSGGVAVPAAWMAAGGGLACLGLAWYLRSKELE